MIRSLSKVATLVVCCMSRCCLTFQPHLLVGTRILSLSSRSDTSLFDLKLPSTEPTAIPSISQLNPLIQTIQPSKTVEIFSQVKQMQADGINVTSLCVGEPDFLPPLAVLQAVVEAVRAGETRYTAVTGTAQLREAIAKDLQRRKNVTYNPQSEIVVANGAKQCVYQGILAIAGANDKVLIPAPYWPSYPEMVRLAGAEPVILETTAESGYVMSADELRHALQDHPDAKMIILCNPSNPTGGVYDEQQLEELKQVLMDYPDMYILADEIYERLVYTKEPCPSIAAIPELFDRTITINGFSKAYAMTGLRLGYLAAPAYIARAVTTIQSQLTSCAGSISQAAGLAALTKVNDKELEQNVVIMQAKRDYVLRQLAQIPNVKLPVPPKGAFYVLPDISHYNKDDTRLCMDLLRDEQLALVPGSSFGAPGTVRLSYATSMDELELAMEKLSRFLGSYDGKTSEKIAEIVNTDD